MFKYLKSGSNKGGKSCDEIVINQQQKKLGNTLQ